MKNENENEIIEELTIILKIHTKKIFKELGKEINDSQAENILSKIGLSLMEKNKIIN